MRLVDKLDVTDRIDCKAAFNPCAEHLDNFDAGQRVGGRWVHAHVSWASGARVLHERRQPQPPRMVKRAREEKLAPKLKLSACWIAGHGRGCRINVASKRLCDRF